MSTADRFYVNPNARTFDEHVRRRRRPRDISPLCRNGYCQPDYAALPGDQCHALACRCYCHHPAEVAAYAERAGRCSHCHGARTIENGRPCPLCFGSGYGAGMPVTRTPPARTPAAVTGSEGGRW